MPRISSAKSRARPSRRSARSRPMSGTHGQDACGTSPANTADGLSADERERAGRDHGRGPGRGRARSACGDRRERRAEQERQRDDEREGERGRHGDGHEANVGGRAIVRMLASIALPPIIRDAARGPIEGPVRCCMEEKNEPRGEAQAGARRNERARTARRARGRARGRRSARSGARPARDSGRFHPVRADAARRRALPPPHAAGRAHRPHGDRAVQDSASRRFAPARGSRASSRCSATSG